MIKLEKISYKGLNAKQKENYNFQKISAVLADYGFHTLRLSDDWQGADFIAQHKDGTTFIKVQLKGRLTFDKKYQDKDLYVAFRFDEQWYLFPHDELLVKFLSETNLKNTDSWSKKEGNGCYSFPKISGKHLDWLSPYKVEASMKEGS